MKAKTAIKAKRFIFTAMTIVLLLISSIFSSSAVAEYLVDATRDVEFSVTAADAEYNPIAGVGYTLYFYGSDLTDIPDIADVNLNELEKTELDLTDENGKASITIPAEKQGVYIISCTTIPNSVSDKSEDFVVTLPYTSDNGETWEYEIDATLKLSLTPATEPASITTTGNGNGLDTNGAGNNLGTSGVKATMNTGDIPIYICVAIAVISFSVGLFFVFKSKRTMSK